MNVLLIILIFPGKGVDQRICFALIVRLCITTESILC